MAPVIPIAVGRMLELIIAAIAKSGDADKPKLKVPNPNNPSLAAEFYVFKIGAPFSYSLTCVGLMYLTPIKEAIVTNPPPMAVAKGLAKNRGIPEARYPADRAPMIDSPVVLYILVKNLFMPTFFAIILEVRSGSFKEVFSSTFHPLLLEVLKL